MNFRQKIALALSAFYLISVIGVALSLHFCGGKLSAIHFTEVAHCKGCKAEKMVKADNCCKNTSVEAKIKDSHESGLKVNLPKNYGTQLFLTPFLSEIAERILPRLFSTKKTEASPLSARVALYAYNCVFRN